MVLARPEERETHPHDLSLRLFTNAGRSSCGPVSSGLLTQTSSLVIWSHLVSMARILLCSSAVRVHGSKAYVKMDVTICLLASEQEAVKGIGQCACCLVGKYGTKNLDYVFADH